MITLTFPRLKNVSPSLPMIIQLNLYPMVAWSRMKEQVENITITTYLVPGNYATTTVGCFAIYRIYMVLTLKSPYIESTLTVL